MLHKPLGLLAELTHRCPLGCPYCSNPLALDAREDELDTAAWLRVFREAAELGVLQLHLSGGEPGARRDLVDLAAGAHAAGLYTNLITSAVGIREETLGALAESGLDHVQISIQDSDAASADRIAGYAGAFARKRTLAAAVGATTSCSPSTPWCTGPTSTTSATWSISRSRSARAASRSRTCNITAGRSRIAPH